MVIAVATLWPVDWAAAGSEPILCVLCGDGSSADLLLNIGLFVPLGWILARHGGSVGRVLLFGLLVSAAIEFLQLGIPGRSATLRDLLGNGLGAGGGALLADLGQRMLRSGVRTRALVGAISFAAAGVLVTGWMLDPVASAGPYFGHRAPRLGHLEPWTGSVGSAAIGNASLPHGLVADTTPVATALIARAPIVITGIGGQETERLAAIVAITNIDNRELLLIGPLGRDLVVRRRRRGQQLRFDAPAERFERVMPAPGAGLPFSITVDDRCASVDGVRRCLAPPSLGHGWTLLHYRHVPVRVGRGLDGLGVALLTLPLAFLLALTGVRPAALATVALAAALYAAAALSGLAQPGWPELAGLVTSLLCGRILARSLRSARGDRAAPGQRANIRS